MVHRVQGVCRQTEAPDVASATCKRECGAGTPSTGFASEYRGPGIKHQRRTALREVR